MNDLTPYVRDGYLNIHVIPHSSKEELVVKEGKLLLYLKAVPEKDKANKELIKFFKKEYGLIVSIKSGLRSREKVLEIRG